MTLRIYCICIICLICMSDCQFYKNPASKSHLDLSCTAFFGCEVSCKKVRLIIREIR